LKFTGYQYKLKIEKLIKFHACIIYHFEVIDPYLSKEHQLMRPILQVQGWGIYFLPRAASMVDYCWWATNTIELIHKFNLYVTIRVRASFDILSRYLLVMALFRHEVVL